MDLNRLKKLLYNVSDIAVEFDYFRDKKIAQYDDYVSLFLSWFKEVGYKNAKIHKSKIEKRDIEFIERKRKHVYVGDLGFNIGSELNDVHYCVVLKDFSYTALVVPITSKKDFNIKSEKVKTRDKIVDIGIIKGLPNAVESYALLNQMRTISKQRLKVYKDKSTGKLLNNLKLTDTQMNSIDIAFIDIIGTKIFTKESFGNDYY